MHAKGLSKLAGAIAAMTLFAVGLTAQSTGTSLGSVKIPAVTANGQALPAGTYTLRLSSDAVTPVVGQSADAAKWVEFVQGGQVKGKELATVVPAAEVKQIAKMAPPAAGTAKVQTLKGADYVRVWFNKGGTHYLVHLGSTAK
jgi:hypothetical protein